MSGESVVVEVEETGQKVFQDFVGKKSPHDLFFIAFFTTVTEHAASHTAFIQLRAPSLPSFVNARTPHVLQ